MKHGRRPDLDAPVEERVEAARHDADHLERLAAEDDLLADDVPVRAEAPLPEAVAEHDDVLEALATVPGQERPAQHRRDAEDLEEVRRRIRPGQLLRLAGAGEIHVPAARDRERVEDVRALGDLLEARHREARLEIVEVRVVVISVTRRSGWSYGSERNSTALTSEKIAVLAPIPSASVRITTSENPGWWTRRRIA